VTHRQRMVEHFIWLRTLDADYARQALRAYLALPSCPCPDISKDIAAAWKQYAQQECTPPQQVK